ncbi:hypothetical protein JQK87_03700 [Streptomyces sp. G44]|nr:hypothetical protein [Streptomyces sp. G44]MBM7167530.1 hypothetical protein [Streptomyces sp. G44]
MPNAELTVEDLLADLLEADEVDGLADLEIDPTEMPTAKGSVIYTTMLHC